MINVVAGGIAGAAAVAVCLPLSLAVQQLGTPRHDGAWQPHEVSAAHVTVAPAIPQVL